MKPRTREKQHVVFTPAGPTWWPVTKSWRLDLVGGRAGSDSRRPVCCCTRPSQSGSPHAGCTLFSFRTAPSAVGHLRPHWEG